MFAFADAERDFHLSVLPVKRKRNQRVALDRDQPEQFPDFRFVQEQFARRLGNVILQIAVRVFVNVDVLEPNFSLFDSRKSIGNLTFAGP